jgi:cytochrome b
MGPIDDSAGSPSAGNAHLAQDGTHPVLVDDSADSHTAGNGHVAQEGMHSVLVWDLPTRVFHWTLVVFFFSALATGDPDRFRDLHVYFGYVVLGLICFRIFWGLAGSRYARFKDFLYGPRVAMAYLADVMAARAGRHVGHNPAGSVGIYLLLALGLVICVTGIVVLGAEEAQGMFKSLADRPLGEFTKGLHESLAWLMLALVLVHIGGVVIESLVHRENLAKAMFTGHKIAGADEGIASNHRWVALVILTCVAGSALWLIHWRLVNIPGLEQLPYVGRQLPDNNTWRDSCGGCHGPFHPSLLPARSWTAHLDRPDNHFGLAWQFDPKTLAEIRAFLQQNAAETGMTEAAYRINKSIPADVTPLRITETPFWIEKHGRIDDTIWSNPAVGSKSNCRACHRDADYGTYDDAAIRLPPLNEKP